MSLETIQSQELLYSLEYVPLFDNLFLASILDKHTQNNSVNKKIESSQDNHQINDVKTIQTKFKNKINNNDNLNESINLIEDSLNDIIDNNNNVDKNINSPLSFPNDEEDNLLESNWINKFENQNQIFEKNDSDLENSDEESEVEFGNMDFGVNGFNSISNKKFKPKKFKKEKLALKFTRNYQGINYVEVNKYLESIIELLASTNFEHHQELIEISDFCMMEIKGFKVKGILSSTHSSTKKLTISKNEEGELEKKRPEGYLDENKAVIEITEFWVKDILNDLMENNSLDNILGGLNKSNNNYVHQNKNKLNFLNTIIYTIEFSELMSLLFGYTIR